MANTGGDLLFHEDLLNYFQCQAGAYSPVTWTEAKDGQVTLTGHEKAIATQHFGREVLEGFRGSKDKLEAEGVIPNLPFRKFPSGEIVYPFINYPKVKGQELRLYFSDSGIKVSVGHFWGLFLKGGEIWLCEFSPWLLEDISRGMTSELSTAISLEGEEDAYQDIINNTIPSASFRTSKQWKRNPIIAANAFKRSNYKCEVRPDIEVFLSRKTGKPFLEAHHFIPMKAQSVFKKNLDVVENICVLSPFMHRKLHHAPLEVILPDLQSLIIPRRQFLDSLEITNDYIFEIYGDR